MQHPPHSPGRGVLFAEGLSLTSEGPSRGSALGDLFLTGGVCRAVVLPAQ